MRQLFAGLLRWRLGWRYLLLVGRDAAADRERRAGHRNPARVPPADGSRSALTYLFFLAVGAITGNLWEETVWGGFVQGRLMARHGLLVGSLLTAVPFFLIHLPLAFENNGWRGTTWRDAFITWGVLLVAAPFLRYLIGTLLIDTGGSTLAAGLMHASINAAGAMVIVPGGWQMVPALILLTLGVVAYRSLRGRSATDGYAPPLTPASEAAQRTTLGVTP